MRSKFDEVCSALGKCIHDSLRVRRGDVWLQTFHISGQAATQRPIINPHQNARIDDPQPSRALHPQVGVDDAVRVAATPHLSSPRWMPYRRSLGASVRVDLRVRVQVYVGEGPSFPGDEAVPRRRRDEVCSRTDRGPHHLGVE